MITYRVECEGKFYMRLLANEVDIRMDLPPVYNMK